MARTNRSQAVHICSFSSAIDKMKRKDQRESLKVLAVIATNPRVSVFEITDNQTIARTVDYLEHSNFIHRPKPQPGYPWCYFELTQAGREMLARQTEDK